MSVQIIPNFITQQEEIELLKKIPSSKVTLGHNRNRIIRYGSKLPYMAPTQPIPTWLLPLVEKASQYMPSPPDSVSINEYHANQSIDWHVDSPSSGPTIVVLSLQSEAIMGLRKKQIPHDYKDLKYKLEPRSLLVIDGIERTHWEHCIYPVNMARFSIVFRKGTKV